MPHSVWPWPTCLSYAGASTWADAASKPAFAPNSSWSAQPLCSRCTQCAASIADCLGELEQHWVKRVGVPANMQSLSYKGNIHKAVPADMQSVSDKDECNRLAQQMCNL